MLINKDKQIEHVRFVSYSGKYPSLCCGTLVLEINGKKYSFGWNENCDYRPFWSSGGCINADYKVKQDEWFINVGELPEELHEYANEIDMVFNENVEYGCCGGCI